MVPALVFQKVFVSYYEMTHARMTFFVVGPPLRPATHPDSPPGRGAQMSQNLFQKSLFERTSVCCWPRILVKIAPNRSSFTFGFPLPVTNTSRFASGEGGGQTSQNLCKKKLFEQISMYCWPRIFVKIDPNRSLFTSGCLAGAPVWPEIHRSGLLGCMTAAEL